MTFGKSWSRFTSDLPHDMTARHTTRLLCPHRVRFILSYLLPPSRRIGSQVNDQTTDTNSEASERTFQRYQRSRREKA